MKTFIMDKTENEKTTGSAESSKLEKIFCFDGIKLF